jgi:hypothetical protein
MKRLLLAVIVASFSFSVCSQTLYVPSGTLGIGSISGSNVGVGISSPSAKLHVIGTTSDSNGAGDLQLEGTGANAILRLGINTNYAWIQSHGSRPLYLNELGNSVIMGLSSNVGIGTASPQVKLDLGELRFDKIAAFPSEGSILEGTWGNYMIGDVSTLQRLRLGVSNDGYTRAEIFLDNSNRPDGTISLKTASTNGGVQTRMLVDGSGNVGINTATPGYKLDVNGTINASSILINGTPFAGGGSQWATSGSNIYYSTAGNVGIGTPSPTGKLDVRGGTTRIINYGTGYNLISGNADPGINDSYFYHLTSTNYHILGSNKNGSGLMRKLGFAIGGGDTESDVKMMIDPSGNVGIGNTNPDAKLTVSGQVHAQEVKVTVNAPGPDYVFEKDYALPSLDQIKTYIEENKHLPEVPSAKEMEKNGVQLGEMNMLLLKKIEEMTLHIIEMNNKIEALKTEVETLKQKK